MQPFVPHRYAPALRLTLKVTALMLEEPRERDAAGCCPLIRRIDDQRLKWVKVAEL